MTEEEKLRKELTEAKAQIAWLKRREELLRIQFAFYIQYSQRVDAGEYPTLTPLQVDQ